MLLEILAFTYFLNKILVTFKQCPLEYFQLKGFAVLVQAWPDLKIPSTFFLTGLCLSNSNNE